MKEFCNQINVFLSSDVQRVDTGVVVPQSGKQSQIIYTDDFFLETNTSNSTASILNTISKKLYVDKLTPTVEKTFASTRSVIIECITDRGKVIILGSMEFPAKMTITPSVNLDIIQLEWKTPAQIFM